MTGHLKVRIRVTEPWDFERLAGSAELTGWTVDHADRDNEEWEVHLDHGFEHHERHVGRLLAGPRYVGEHLSRMFDAVTGFPVRLAYRQDGAWHYAFTGMIAQRHDDDDHQDETAQ
ncbi:hypothetical protein [Sphingobium ummariense]|uniref:Uncharacterized protein n=1 Tax=Sphingobium ummariense RL-3 TaxID=1346791 RepID=T0KD76_9SPHN|nr:hypothetical protein [Sphingobium ummariense]EQB31488.1 hypothetical protein M529_14310 [Sphingobium ummariense RL-3]